MLKVEIHDSDGNIGTGIEGQSRNVTKGQPPLAMNDD
jgi:hypothetical protein